MENQESSLTQEEERSQFFHYIEAHEKEKEFFRDIINSAVTQLEETRLWLKAWSQPHCDSSLVPGFDGSCRAVMGAMALEKPLIASKSGILPELVQENRNGILVDLTAQSITSAMLHFYNNREKCSAFGKASREIILKAYALEKSSLFLAIPPERLLSGGIICVFFYNFVSFKEL